MAQFVYAHGLQIKTRDNSPNENISPTKSLISERSFKVKITPA